MLLGRAFQKWMVHSGERPVFRQPRFGDYLVGICGEGIEWAWKLNYLRFLSNFEAPI